MEPAVAGSDGSVGKLGAGSSGRTAEAAASTMSAADMKGLVSRLLVAESNEESAGTASNALGPESVAALLASEAGTASAVPGRSGVPPARAAR